MDVKKELFSTMFPQECSNQINQVSQHQEAIHTFFRAGLEECLGRMSVVIKFYGLSQYHQLREMLSSSLQVLLEQLPLHWSEMKIFVLRNTNPWKIFNGIIKLQEKLIVGIQILIELQTSNPTPPESSFIQISIPSMIPPWKPQNDK